MIKFHQVEKITFLIGLLCKYFSFSSIDFPKVREIRKKTPHLSYHEYRNQGLFYKIILGHHSLCMRASCQCSLGAQEAVSPLIGSRCITLVGSHQRSAGNHNILSVLRLHNGHFWTVAAIYEPHFYELFENIVQHGFLLEMISETLQTPTETFLHFFEEKKHIQQNFTAKTR